MNLSNIIRPRLHEWAFGLLLAVTALRLAAVGAWPLALGFGGMAALVPAVAAVATRWPGPVTSRVRLAMFPVWVNVTYPLLGGVVAQLGMGSCDPALLRADRWLFGETPALWLAAAGNPLLSDVLSACYLAFFPAVTSAFVIAVMDPGAKGIRLFNGLITIYAIGFLGYTLVPAVGPHLVLPDLAARAPQGGWLTLANAAVVAGGSNRVDVFPSLHLAITGFLMGFLFRYRRGWFFALAAPAVGLAAATVYLGYHYAVDLVAGLALAAAGLRFSSIPIRSDESHPAF